MRLPRLLARSLESRLLIYVALLCLAGCSANPKPPLAPPAVNAAVTHHLGSPLAAPATQPVAAFAPRDAWAVQVSWIALEQIPPDLESLTSSARLISDPRGGQPIRASAQLTRGARWVQPDKVDPFLADLSAGKFGRSAAISTTRAALPNNVTGVFNLADQSKDRAIELAVYRPAKSGQIQLALSVGRERIVLNPMPMTLPARLALAIPSQIAGSQVQATLAVIDLSQGIGPEHAEAAARCAKDLSALPSTQPAITNDWPALAAAVQMISTRQNPRRALIYLAGQTGSTLCSDVALIADDPTLAKLSERITAKTGQPPRPMDKSQIGWLLDAACFEELSGMQSAEKLPPELSAILTAYAGEPARHAGSLDDLAAAQSREELDARLLAENLIYLEDNSPSARVRAYDWLKGRGHAPAGYDPLGAIKERRSALEKALYSNAVPAAGGGQ